MGSDYLSIVRALPRPTDEQIRNFAGFTSDDHSWYKKLPFDGAGEPFFFYLRPHVHQDFVKRGDGSSAWRNVVVKSDDRGIRWFRIDLQDGDLDRDTPVNHAAKGITTADYHQRLGHLSYWNFGPPDQPRSDAIRSASAGLKVYDDVGERLTIPDEVLELGLVYLRATMSPLLGPNEDAYDLRRRVDGLPTHIEDRARQLSEMVAAMTNVVSAIYDRA